jgi:hypothetical protein
VVVLPGLAKVPEQREGHFWRKKWKIKAELTVTFLVGSFEGAEVGLRRLFADIVVSKLHQLSSFLCEKPVNFVACVPHANSV